MASWIKMDQIFTKKNILNLLLLGIMVLAIPLSINLIRQQQILKSRAAEAKIEFLDKAHGGSTDCVTSRGGKQVATCPNISVKITAPTGGDVHLTQTAFLVSKVYAQECGINPDDEQCYCDGQIAGFCSCAPNDPSCNAEPPPPPPAEPPPPPPAEPPPAGGTCPGDSECGAYWGFGASCNPVSGELREDGCYGGCTRELQACEGGQMWCINANCPNSACYDAEEGGNQVTTCPTTTTPSCPDHATACWIGAGCNDANKGSADTACQSSTSYNQSVCTLTEGQANTNNDGCTLSGSTTTCKDLPQYCDKDQTGKLQTFQCTGGRFDPSDPFAASNGCVRNCNPVSGDPLQCATGNPGKTPAGTGGCCTKKEDCKVGNNTPDGRSTAGWTCTDNNTRCIGSGNNACKAPSAGVGTSNPQPPGAAAGTITQFRYVWGDRTDINNPAKASWQPLPTSGTIIVATTITDTTPGQKFLWVQFGDSSNPPKVTEPPTSKQLDFSGEDPAITGSACDINLDLKDNSLLFKINGQNFGDQKSGSSLKADSTNLEIKSWKDNKVIARLPNPSDTSQGHTFQVTLTRSDGATATQSCDVSTTQITLGAKWICDVPTGVEIPNVNMSIFEMVGVGTSAAQNFSVGSKTKETVTVSKGVIKNIKTKLKEGSQYKICLKAPRSVEVCSDQFTATDGNNVLLNFSVPFGDLDGNGCIDAFDVSKFRQQYGKVTANKNCDFNNDNQCNAFEFSCMLRDYNKCDQKEPQ